MAATGTLFGYTESQVAGFGIAAGIAALIFFKLAVIRYLVRSNKVGKVGALALYSILALGMVSIIAIVLLLYFWKV